MTPDEKQRILNAIIPPAIRTLAEFSFTGHCLQAAALLVTVLQKCGLTDAYPLTVGARAMNPAMRKFIDQHGVPRDPASMLANQNAGGAMVVLGRDAEIVPPGNWAGHLVVIVPKAFGKTHAFLDLTITQVDTPAWGLYVRPVYSTVNDDFVNGRLPFVVDVDDCRIAYEAYPADRSYGAWDELMAAPGLAAAADEIVQITRGRIEPKPS